MEMIGTGCLSEADGMGGGVLCVFGGLGEGVFLCLDVGCGSGVGSV